MRLGCIGDDFTGSSDLANTLAKGGMRVMQYVGIPDEAAGADVDAGVVALKSRSIPVEEAVAQSLAALDWLRAQGCTQFFFKYCSTFDSTPEGNIGPVAEAMAKALEAKAVVVCPAFPAAGRSVYQGHLFVGDTLLHQSGMQNHPVTPMTDADLRRWLAPQTSLPVGHVPAAEVFAGADEIKAALAREAGDNPTLVVVDAIRDADLVEIGRAAKDAPLITGGSGVALGLPGNFGFAPGSVDWTPQTGKTVALSGSCSTTTRGQVTYHAARHPVREVSAKEVIEGTVSQQALVDWVLGSTDVPLVFSSADPAAVRAAQAEFGASETSAALEQFFAGLARGLVDAGVTKLVSAGGETSGAIVEGLGLGTLLIGPEIDPGVPALRARQDLVLTLKSGNFGAEDIFEKANRMLGGL